MKLLLVTVIVVLAAGAAVGAPLAPAQAWGGSRQ
jgi:hypothetical protein